MNVKTVNEYLKLLKLYIITSFKLYILREKNNICMYLSNK